MPGSTPNRGYPFPLGTDRIDIAGDARRLAEALDADVDALAEQSGSGSSALQAEIAIRSSADQDLSNRITAEATARNNRDNDLINDYVARDNNIYNQFRADDRYYAITMWSHNAYQNDRIRRVRLRRLRDVRDRPACPLPEPVLLADVRDGQHAELADHSDGPRIP